MRSGRGTTPPMYPVGIRFANRLDGLSPAQLNVAQEKLREDPLFTIENFLSRCPAELQARLSMDRPLSAMTTLRVGGPAALVCSVETPEEARRFQDICINLDAPTYVLGAGSNVLADDRGFAGVILHINTRNLELQGDTVRVGAGLSFDDLVADSLRRGLTGLEFASGIPGTVGGALVGNAGCYGHEIGEFLVEATVLRRDGVLETVGPEAFGFRYRATSLRETGDLVLEAVMVLERGDTAKALDERQQRLADRRAKHPVDTPSAGSWFRNLPPAPGEQRRRAAGYFLEQVRAKEMREGDARVFPGHANMIINAGAARSGQIQTLARRMQQAVHERFELDLVEEVRYLAPAGE